MTRGVDSGKKTLGQQKYGTAMRGEKLQLRRRN